jgi:tRNA-Thr(GGU) m(6)t(6)A37 methyltransferase TsaA
MQKIEYRPIGFVRSPFNTAEGTPIQPPGAAGIEGALEIYPEFVGGLEDLEGFSHIILLYHFHLSKRYVLKVKPFLDERMRGIFATRAPLRPNPIGISIVRLDRIENGTVYVKDIDVVDGTPLLDIKPYVPQFDMKKDVRTGWLEGRSDKSGKIKADRRFQD